MAIIRSEMAGTVLEIKVKVGDAVDVGQELAIFESMKMEVPLASKVKGKVTQVAKTVGDFVNEGETVFEIA